MSKKLRGGSLASDNVVKAVDTAAFEKLDSYFTNVVGGCSKCKSGCKCGKCGGAWGKKKVVAAAKKAVKAVKAAKPAPKKSTAKKPVASSTKSHKGGSRVAYNYDGMLLESPLQNSTNVPGAAVPMPYQDIVQGGNLRKLGELSNSSSYRLKNKVGGADGENPTYPLGINYKTAILTSGMPVGTSERSAVNVYSPLNELANMPGSSVPAPMAKMVEFGNNMSDAAPTAFSYAPTVGGGLVKKLVVAAVARHVAKKAVKAYKKKKTSKTEIKTPKSAPKSAPKSIKSSKK